MSENESPSVVPAEAVETRDNEPQPEAKRAITVRPPFSPAPGKPLDPQQLLMAAVESGAGVEHLERIMDLAERMRTQTAKEAWHESMAEFQRRCPPVVKEKTARVKSKRTGREFSYQFASLDGIMRTVSPLLGELGLSVSWEQRYEKGHVVASCRVSHTLGHSRDSGPVSVPVDAESGMGASAAQRVGIAMTYARRYACMAILGIAPEDDVDGQGTGDRVVQPPRRTSDTPPSTPAQSAPPTEGVETEITSIDVAEGQRKDGSTWTRYRVTFKDGLTAATFSSTIGANAHSWMAEGLLVRRVTEETEKGTKIVSLEPA